LLCSNTQPVKRRVDENRRTLASNANELNNGKRLENVSCLSEPISIYLFVVDRKYSGLCRLFIECCQGDAFGYPFAYCPVYYLTFRRSVIILKGTKMNITLRKANALQNSIQDAVKNIKVDLNVEINEFQSVEDVLAKANAELIENDTRRQKLTMALYNIRALIGTANAASGISTSLAKAAFIDKRIAQLEQLAGATAMTDLDVIKGKLDKIKNDKGENSRRSIYGYNDTVTTSVLGKDQIKQAKDEVLNLKKQKQKLNDEILEFNVKTEIPLSDDTVATLQAEKLL